MSNWCLKGDGVPPRNKILIAWCPQWSEIGYQACQFVNGKFYYDEQPNDGFDECIVKWSILEEVEL